MSKDWITVPLGKVITLQRGFDLPNRLRKAGDVPIVTSSGTGDTHNEAIVKGPGVVTGRYGTIGEVFYIERDFWPLNTTLFVRDFHGNDPLFISYLLRTIDFQTHSGKSGVPGVNRNDLHEEVISLPSSLAEQQAIAEALSDVDGLISALDALIAKKRALKGGAMQELLTGQRRLPGFTGDWAVKMLGDMADVKTGPFGAQLHESDYVRDGTPIITVEHLGEFGIECKDTPPMVSDQDKERLKQYMLDEGDIVFSRVGSIDRNALVKASERGWLFSGRLLRVRPATAANSAFLSYYFQGEEFKSRIRSVAVGQTMASLNTVILNNALVAFPTLFEQTAIAQILADMDAELAALAQKRAKTVALKQGMMQALLTGQVRLG